MSGHSETGWTYAGRPDGATTGQFVLFLGGGWTALARWNDRDARWYDGYRHIDPSLVHGFLELPEFRADEPVEAWPCEQAEGQAAGGAHG
ncbi:hypothetical protein [Luteimonas sp. SDU82]|uniref:hypothetical protein n=1 Tax=Luteimonas sp. SDU82 TaxID=3422592 RepID=UPI003EC132FB